MPLRVCARPIACTACAACSMARLAASDTDSYSCNDAATSEGPGSGTRLAREGEICARDRIGVVWLRADRISSSAWTPTLASDKTPVAADVAGPGLGTCGLNRRRGVGATSRWMEFKSMGVRSGDKMPGLDGTTAFNAANTDSDGSDSGPGRGGVNGGGGAVPSWD